MQHLIIRQEKGTDFAAVRKVLTTAFEQEDEAGLVELLRMDQAFISELSLVAELDGKVIGYILFTKISIVAEDGITNESLALAPMAVLPAYQNKGVGVELVKAGLDAARKSGYTSVIVLGHHTYYPRFAFRPAAEWYINAPFNVPSDAFMALELVPGSLKEVRGTVVYAKPFNQV